ncbi:MAG: methionyl-tRNA formyltransferase [Elusimicrobiota bacterium]
MSEKVDLIFISGTQTGCRYIETIKNHSRANLALTVTGPDKYRGRGRKLKSSRVALYCKKQDLDVYKPENISSEDSVKTLRKVNPDIGLVIDYGQLLSSEILQIFKKGAYNIHYSLLPNLRGASPVRYALLKGYKETGVTLMKMNERLDEGEIVFRKKVQIKENDNHKTLKKKLDSAGKELVEKLLDIIADGKIPSSTPQKEFGKGSYAPKINKDICKIDWTSDAQKIVNQIKALNPAPGCHTFGGGDSERLKLAKAKAVDTDRGEPGEIIEVTKKYFVVAAGTGGVKILKLQPAGKRVMDTASYLAGHDVKEGEKFE